MTDNYKIGIHPNGDIDAKGTLANDKVTLKKRGNNLNIEAIKIHDKLLHPIINFSGLQGGLYTFKYSGDPSRVMNGEIIIDGGIMKDFKAYNNTLALMNTIPALATLNSPGFSEKGFYIKRGSAKYRKIGKKIIFDSIKIEGSSANFVGEGVIDLAKNSINLSLAIQTAREFGKVVGNIPIFGYILMGDDKSMTVGLKITGSLDKPKVETSAVKGMLKTPLDILKRTFESPKKSMSKHKSRIKSGNSAVTQGSEVAPKKKRRIKILPFNVVSP